MVGAKVKLFAKDERGALIDMGFVQLPIPSKLPQDLPAAILRSGKLFVRQSRTYVYTESPFVNLDAQVRTK
jgi:hypothetical protein